MTEPESTKSEGDAETSREPASDEHGDVDGLDGVDERRATDDEHHAMDDGDERASAETTGDGAATADEADSGGIEDAVDEALLERIRDGSPEEIAREITTLELEVDGLEAELRAKDAEIEELTSKLKRKHADFENYKKRMQRRREEETQRATAALLERLLDVRDNLDRALAQDEDADIRDGVASTLRQFDDVLESEDVSPIEPEPGEDVDPHRHEVLARVDADVPAGTIAGVHRTGYAMADSVLREAQVTVAEGSNDGERQDSGEEVDGVGPDGEGGDDGEEAEDGAGGDGAVP